MYVFNALSGQLDNINPLSSMSSDGELQIAYPINISKDLFGFDGIKYYIGSGGMKVSGPPIGQPIPIGMGLTMTYSQGYDTAVNIGGGQPMGFANYGVTYSDKIT